MKSQGDFQGEWTKVKKQLVQFSEEAMKLAKKGEKELKVLSRKGKVHLDRAALNLKKEHLYFLIGQEYVKAKCPGSKTPRLEKLIVRIHHVENDLRSLTRQLEKTGGK